MSDEFSTTIVNFAAGEASRSATRPAGAIGCYVTATAAFTIQIAGTGGKYPFPAGGTSFFIAMRSHTSIKIEHDDATPSDTGVVSIAWVVGRVGL